MQNLICSRLLVAHAGKDAQCLRQVLAQSEDAACPYFCYLLQGLYCLPRLLGVMYIAIGARFVAIVALGSNVELVDALLVELR